MTPDLSVGPVLVVDGANVVGSRPDGWWRDRPGAAARLHDRLVVADLPYERIVLVLEGRARAGVPAGTSERVTTVHADRDGDAEILAQATALVRDGRDTTVVTADRALVASVQAAGAATVGPGALLDQL